MSRTIDVVLEPLKGGLRVVAASKNVAAVVRWPLAGVAARALVQIPTGKVEVAASQILVALDLERCQVMSRDCRHVLGEFVEAVRLSVVGTAAAAGRRCEAVDVRYSMLHVEELVPGMDPGERYEHVYTTAKSHVIFGSTYFLASMLGNVS